MHVLETKMRCCRMFFLIFQELKLMVFIFLFLVNSPSWLPLFREDINALLSSPFDLMQRILGGNAEILG